VAGSCVQGNERLGSIKGQEFLYEANNYQSLKNDFTTE
jgi:hypothetical protein